MSIKPFSHEVFKLAPFCENKISFMFYGNFYMFSLRLYVTSEFSQDFLN